MSSKRARSSTLQLDLHGSPVRLGGAEENPDAASSVALLTATGDVVASPRSVAWADGPTPGSASVEDAEAVLHQLEEEDADAALADTDASLAANEESSHCGSPC